MRGCCLSESKFTVSYPTLLSHYLRNMMIAWSWNDRPEGVSIFFTLLSMPEVGTFRSDLTANLEASQGAGFSTETAQSQTKEMKPSIPSRYIVPSSEFLCDLCSDL